MRWFAFSLAVIVLSAAPAVHADVIAIGTFPGGSVTTAASGFSQEQASLNLADFGSLVDSGKVGANGVSGTVYYYWTAQSNATDYTDPPTVDGADDFAGMQLWRDGGESLGVGNNWPAWAYSTFGPDMDLVRSSDNAYMNVQSGASHLFVVKITYNANADDNVTVWMDPIADNGDTQANTVYAASGTGNFAFDQLFARTGSSNNNNSWTFSDVTFVEDWSDVPEPATLLLTAFGGAALLARRRRRA